MVFHNAMVCVEAATTLLSWEAIRSVYLMKYFCAESFVEPMIQRSNLGQTFPELFYILTTLCSNLRRRVRNAALALIMKEHILAIRKANKYFPDRTTDVSRASLVAKLQ